MQGDGFVFEFVLDKIFAVFGAGDEDGDLVVFDEFEILGDGAVLEEKWECWIANTLKLR